MLSDTEVDALALQVLAKAVEVGGDREPARFDQVNVMDSGELVPAMENLALNSRF